MIMDRWIADAGEVDRSVPLGQRAGLLSRRSFLVGSAVGLGALGLAGCATSDGMSLAEAARVYGPMPDEKFPIPAVDVSKVDPKYFRRTVRYDIQGSARHDHRRSRQLTTSTASRATGPPPATAPMSAATGSCGAATPMSGASREWATWTPPKEMIRRQPEAAKYARGMPGGLDNPLGARTLYLYQNGAYTLYTIYASSDPETIGSGITSGCVGLLSQDMIHLYSRTPVKTKVVVLPA